MTVRFTPVVDPPQPDEYIFTVMPNGNLLLRFWAHQHCSFRLVLWIKAWLLVKCHCISQWIIGDDKCLPAEWCTLLSRLSLPWTSWTTSVMLLIPGTLICPSFLPTKERVSKFPFCCTLNESGGERAMLIRGCKNWGLCIGKWDGVFDGVFLACLDHEHHDTNNSSAPASKFEVRRTATSFCTIDEPWQRLTRAITGLNG